MKIQKELDETKIVLHKTIESVLERGETIPVISTPRQGEAVSETRQAAMVNTYCKEDYADKNDSQARKSTAWSQNPTA